MAADTGDEHMSTNTAQYIPFQLQQLSILQLCRMLVTVARMNRRRVVRALHQLITRALLHSVMRVT